MNFSKLENLNTIGIYNKLDVSEFIHCVKDTFIDHSFETHHDGQWILYCLTKTGCIYRVEKSCEREIARYQSPTKNNQSEIFSDLLGHEDSNDVIQLHISTQPVYVLRDSDILIRKVENSVALCVSSSHIIVITEDSLFYKVFLYNKLSNTNTVEGITRLSRNISHVDTDSFQTCRIVKIVTCDCIDSTDTLNPDVLNIDVNLFKKVFGEETALFNSPVLLYSQQDGTVCYTPLSSFDSVTDESLDVRHKSNRNKWSTLCLMTSGVVEITTLTLKKDDRQSDEYCKNALCICGQDGQVVIFWSENGKHECTISELSIYSPVLSVKSFHNKIYNTIGGAIFESIVDIPAEKDSSLLDLQILNTKLVSNKMVTVIHAISTEGYVMSQASPCIMYCTCQNGQIQAIRVQVSSQVDIKCDDQSTAYGNLKDILTSIDDVGTKRQQFRNLIKAQEENIKQLGIASYLNTFNGKETKEKTFNEGEEGVGRNKSTELPFSVTLNPRSILDGDNEMVEMTVSIINQMPVKLSADWTLNVSVISLTNTDYISNASMQIDTEMKPNEKLVLPIQIPFKQILSTCKLIAKANLVTEKMKQPGRREFSLKEHLSFPIYERAIDIIDCLIPVSEINQVNKGISKITPISHTCMTEQTKERMQRLKLSTEKIEGANDVNVCTRNIVHLPRTGISNGKNGQDTVAQKLLEVLFGKTITDNSVVKPSNCQLTTVLGHVVQLCILPAANVERDGDVWMGDMDTYEVVVRSYPYIAAALHKALSHRQQQIVQAFTNNSSKQPSISVHQCRKAIKIAEDAINDVNGITANNTTAFTSAFQKLRSIFL